MILENSPYRIADLVRKTGITKETIHYYINEGLLPKAHKTSRNMAWYGDEHVERLKTIKELQEKQFLPLKAIKAVLNDAKDYTFSPEQQRTIEGIQKKLYQRNYLAESANWVALPALMKKYKLSEQEIADLVSIGLLNPRASEGGPLIEASDEALIRIWSELRDSGFSAERGFSAKDMEAFENVIALLFDQEVKLVAERIEQIDTDEAAQMIENAIPRLNEMIALLHQRKVRQFLINFKKS
jgi:DNA-binding transcriptional MerR regulator